MQVSQFFDTGLQPAHCPLVAIGQNGGSCSAWAAGDSVHELEAVIQGADDPSLEHEHAPNRP